MKKSDEDREIPKSETHASSSLKANRNKIKEKVFSVEAGKKSSGQTEAA